MQRNVSEVINQRDHQLSWSRVSLPRTSVRTPRQSQKLLRPQQWPSTAAFSNHNWVNLSDERMRWRTNWSWLMFLHAGMWGRTKVWNFWFSLNKTCDVDLLTCNRTKQSTSLWFICCSDPLLLTQTSCLHFARCKAAIDYVLWCFYDICVLNLVICIDVQDKRQAAADHYRCLTLHSATCISLFVFKFLALPLSWFESIKNPVKYELKSSSFSDKRQKQFWWIRSGRGKFFARIN